MPFHVERVGHVVLRVRDLERSLRFYEGVLGLTEVARRDFGEGPMAFLSSGNSHHDVALVETGTRQAAGGSLHHFALRIGDSRDDLVEAKRYLEIELYVDADPQLWRDDPSRVANSDALAL